MKECTKCKVIKPLDQYWKRKTGGRQGRYAYCKECGKVTNILNFYYKKCNGLPGRFVNSAIKH